MASSVTSRGSSRGGEDAVAEARCRAARDKLRVVREAMEAHATHLQALDAYEVEKAAYLARRAPLDATEEARRARSEAASALAAAEQGETSTGAQAAALDEENVAASRAYEDAVAALGPVPAPPPFRDHLNDARVAADGTDGPPLFLLTCGVLEGAGERGVALLKELMARGARAEDCFGSRPNHGKRLAPLCLALAHLERFADPGDPEPDAFGAGGFFGAGADALLRGMGIVSTPEDRTRAESGFSTGASSETSSNAEVESPRADSAAEKAFRFRRESDPASAPETPRSVARFGSEGSESGAESQTEETAEERRTKTDDVRRDEYVEIVERVRPSSPDARGDDDDRQDSALDDLDALVSPPRPARLRDVKNAVTALIAGGADARARCRLGAFRDGPHEPLARPYRSVCAYRGVDGTVGDALFLAVVAATSPTTPLETRVACVDVAARLVASGADPEARGTRPGSGHASGENLAPLAMVLAAMERDACDSSGVSAGEAAGEEKRFFEYALDAVAGNPNATLAAVLLSAKAKPRRAADEDDEGGSVVGSSPRASDAGTEKTRAEPRVRLSAARIDELLRSLKNAHGRDVTREEARALVGETRESHAYYADSESSASRSDVAARDADAGDAAYAAYTPAVDIGAVTTFAHVPTKREFRTRRLVVGETGAAAPASGPPLWHAACAAAEGAGAPAVAVALKLLKLGADPDAVGSRPGHCLPGTPALAMCVAALRGRARHPNRRRDQDWWPASETESAAKVPSGTEAVSSSPSTRAGSVSFGGSGVSPAAQRARAAFEADVVRGLERFLETSAGREAFRAPTPSAPSVPDERIGFWSRAVGAPFAWSARAEADTVASANAIAAAHRDARLAAEEALRESVADLQTHVPIERVERRDTEARSEPADRSSREARARADALALTEALVAARADCDAPMKVIAKHASELETDDAFPLGIAVGLFSEAPLGDACALSAARTLMDRGGADASARGVCAFPLVSSPLFAATRAIRRNVPESVDLFRRLLRAGADVDGLGQFPEGSERTPLIELLHTLREGKVFRPGVLSLIRELVDARCDVRAPRPEVYSPTPHAAYAFREDEDPLAAPGESSHGSDVETSESFESSQFGSTASLLSAAAEEAASAFASKRAGAENETGVTKKKEGARRVRLSAARVDELAQKLSTQYGFDVTHAQVRELVGETRDSHAYTVSESSAFRSDSPPASETASSGAGLGAFFPARPPRVGRCEHAPLFWALEAVCGDGFDEARQAVELIANALGGDVDAPQGANHHSHVTGSLVAMATAAAIRAAAPLATPAPLAGSASSAAMRRGANDLADRSEDERSVASSAGRAPRAQSDGPSVTTDEVRRDDAASVATEASAGTSNGAPADAYAALAAAAAEANAVADMCDARKAAQKNRDAPSKLPPPADRSRFRSRARGVLGASRFEKATRSAAREKAREAAAALLAAEEARALARREDARARAWRGVGVRTMEGYEDTRAVSGAESRSERVPAAGAEKGDAPPGRLDAEAEALHADLDDIKKRNAPSVAGDDVADVADAAAVAASPTPPPGLMDALAALLGRGGPEAGASDDARRAAAEDEARARAARDRAARLDAAQKTAVFFLRATKRVDAVCVNPLLAEVGAASLVPFEYTPLFCALHGAATAVTPEQMEVANGLAMLCLDRGADVSAPGAHANIGGDQNWSKSASSALRSYPLMWAVAAALRGDASRLNPRVDDALAVVKRVLMAGADPTAVDFRVAAAPDAGDGGAGTYTYASKVLHLWDERALLLEVFDQTEWQRVMTLRLDLQRLLGEAGARAAFRADSGMSVVARRAAPFAESFVSRRASPSGEDESSPEDGEERVKWAEGVRRTRRLLEHGGVPSQYAVWVWPTTEREAFPPEDGLRRKSFSAKDKEGDGFGDGFDGFSAFEFEYAEAHRTPRPFGAPARAGEIEVLPRRADLRRPGVASGAVDVSRVRAEDVFEGGAGLVESESRETAAIAAATSEKASRALASRLLWEARADGVSERADAARRASVLAVRELLAGEPAEPPASSDSSDAEPAPSASASSSDSSDASEYESRFAFVPQAPRRRARLAPGAKKPSRGVVHAALVFMGFRKKKRPTRTTHSEEKKPAEDAEGDGDRDARRMAFSATRAEKERAPFAANENAVKEPFRRPTLAAARDEALGTVAEALMRNPNSGQADRWHGVPSLAAMARRETTRCPKKKPGVSSRDGKELADAFAFADPPPPAFGALGRYMLSVERDEAPDWNAATRRPMRRLLT